MWDVDDEHGRRLADEGRAYSKENAVRKLKSAVQRRDEQALYKPVAGEFPGYEEPHDVRQVLEARLAVPAAPVAPWAKWC